MLEQWRAGDVLVTTGLHWHARSIRDPRDSVERIGQADGGLRSLAEPWADTTTRAGDAARFTTTKCVRTRVCRI